MTVVKVVELVGESTTGWEDAVQAAVREASRTIRNITGVHVKNITGTVDTEGNIVEFKANVELAFAVDGT
ncbi:MAG: dodecin domain-containing protein [Firmicutes bacterium]|nr:dodecin domain-containing protein [Bacillota bacterium]